MLNIGETVEDITAKALHIDRNLVKQSSNFSLDLGAYSLDVIELVMCLEETFDIDIPDNCNYYRDNKGIIPIIQKINNP